MKYLLFLLISIPGLAQSDTTKNILLNRDTLLTIKTVVNKTASVSYSETSVVQIVKPFKSADTIVTPPPIIPGAIQGFGQTAGGSNFAPTYVSTVTQLRTAIKSNSNVVITKGGTYNFAFPKTGLANLTVDGSQADGPVIFTNTGGVVFETCHDIIIRGIAIRNTGDDCFAVNDNCKFIVLDHCSVSNGGDGSADITNSSNITVQWCIIGNSKSGASLIDYPGTSNVSIHHNLYVGGFERNALIGSQQKPNRTDLVCDFANNIIYGWQNYGTDVNFGGTANLRNNYYYSTSNPGNAIQTANGWGGYPQGYAYVSGNFSGNGLDINKVNNHALWPVPDQYAVVMQDACSAAKLVLANVGPPKKDATDQNLINKVTLVGCQN